MLPACSTLIIGTLPERSRETPSEAALELSKVRPPSRVSPKDCFKVQLKGCGLMWAPGNGKSREALIQKKSASESNGTRGSELGSVAGAEMLNKRGAVGLLISTSSQLSLTRALNATEVLYG